MLDGKVNSESWKEKFLEYSENKDVRLGNVKLDMSKMEGLDNFDPTTAHVFSTLLCLSAVSGFQTHFGWMQERLTHF